MPKTHCKHFAASDLDFIVDLLINRLINLFFNHWWPSDPFFGN
jgi:hypothetical protein